MSIVKYAQRHSRIKTSIYICYLKRIMVQISKDKYLDAFMLQHKIMKNNANVVR